MNKVLISWSGGKDSTASVLLHIAKGTDIEIINYIPYLTDEIPLIAKEHYNFIINTAERFSKFGKVHIVKGITYHDLFYSEITRGENKGKLKGYSLGFGYCAFRDYSKLKSLQEISKKIIHKYIDIGIAFDEKKRQNQLNDYKKSILCEMKITESEAFTICKKFKLLSPHYKNNSRDGCAICPNASKNVLKEYIKDYPEAKEIFLQMDNDYFNYYMFDKIKNNKGLPIMPYRNFENFTDRILK